MRWFTSLEAERAARETSECVCVSQTSDRQTESALACQELEDDEAVMAAYDAYESGWSEQGELSGGMTGDEDAAAEETEVADELATRMGQMAVVAGVAVEAELRDGGASGPMEVESGGGGEPVEAAAAAAAGVSGSASEDGAEMSDVASTGPVRQGQSKKGNGSNARKREKKRRARAAATGGADGGEADDESSQNQS